MLLGHASHFCISLPVGLPSSSVSQDVLASLTSQIHIEVSKIMHVLQVSLQHIETPVIALWIWCMSSYLTIHFSLPLKAKWKWRDKEQDPPVPGKPPRSVTHMRNKQEIKFPWLQCLLRKQCLSNRIKYWTICSAFVWLLFDGYGQ